MRRLRTLLDGTGLGLILVGGVVLMVSVIWGTADVVGTQFLGKPIPGSVELISNNMVFIVFGSLAYVQRQRGHIRVEFFYTRAGPRTQAAMDAITHLVAIVFFALLVWQGTERTIYSVGLRESTAGLIRFPVYPAKIMLVVGTYLLLIQLFIDLRTDLRRLAGEETPTAPTL